MFQFCRKDILGVNFLYISKEDMALTREILKERFTNARTVPGTQSFHHFVPKASSSIIAKRVSIDEKNAIEFDFFSSKPSELKISIMSQIMFYAYMTTNIGLVWWINWTVNSTMYMLNLCTLTTQLGHTSGLSEMINECHWRSQDFGLGGPTAWKILQKETIWAKHIFLLCVKSFDWGPWPPLWLRQWWKFENSIK